LRPFAGSILLVLLVLAASPCRAQDWQLGVILGEGVFRVGEIADSFGTSQGVLSSTFTQFGGFTQVNFGKDWLIGGTVGFVKGKPFAGKAAPSELSGFEYNAHFGWIIGHYAGADFYPYISLGGGVTKVSINPEVAGRDFSDIVDDPRQLAKLSTSDLILGIGLGGRWKLSWSSEGKKGILLGFQAGFRSTLSQPHWKMVDEELTSDVSGMFQGPYGQISLSFFTAINDER
jgi:hypothetical protein